MDQTKSTTTSKRGKIVWTAFHPTEYWHLQELFVKEEKHADGEGSNSASLKQRQQEFHGCVRPMFRPQTMHLAPNLRKRLADPPVR